MTSFRANTTASAANCAAAVLLPKAIAPAAPAASPATAVTRPRPAMPTELECGVMSPIRAAREPPMNTLLEPVCTSFCCPHPPRAASRSLRLRSSCLPQTLTRGDCNAEPMVNRGSCAPGKRTVSYGRRHGRRALARSTRLLRALARRRDLPRPRCVLLLVRRCDLPRSALLPVVARRCDLPRPRPVARSPAFRGGSCSPCGGHPLRGLAEAPWQATHC